MVGLDDNLPANTTAARYNLLKPDNAADSSEGSDARTTALLRTTPDNPERGLGSPPAQTVLLEHTPTRTAPRA